VGGRTGKRSQQRGDGLTFDTKGEIIISSGGIADLPVHLTLFSPFLHIHSSFIIGSCLVCIHS
jgi:hypothetical protein